MTIVQDQDNNVYLLKSSNPSPNIKETKLNQALQMVKSNLNLAVKPLYLYYYLLGADKVVCMYCAVRDQLTQQGGGRSHFLTNNVSVFIKYLPKYPYQSSVSLNLGFFDSQMQAVEQFLAYF